MWLLNTILNVLFPVNCLNCKKAGENLCVNCLNASPQAERESEQWIFPIYDYRHPPVKKAIWLLKYKGKTKLAHIFAGVLYGRILEELSDLIVFENFRDPVLVPIPLSKERYKERGYNQTELICKELIKLDNHTNFALCKNVLVKNKETVRQAHIKERKDRLKNLVGSFEIINPEPIQNKNIILIDDVTTTGATLKEARVVLKKAGARKIIAFTIAH
ncbi:MAG: ComF family protein [bacterium]|nr:ComF family protein [bacterium]